MHKVFHLLLLCVCSLIIPAVYLFFSMLFVVLRFRSVVPPIPPLSFSCLPMSFPREQHSFVESSLQGMRESKKVLKRYGNDRKCAENNTIPFRHSRLRGNDNLPICHCKER